MGRPPARAPSADVFPPRPIVVVSVGARGGLSCLEPLWPHVVVHAFEPDPTACAALAGRSVYRDLHVAGVAVGRAEGTALLHVTRHPALSSLRAPDLVTYEELFGHIAAFPGHLAALEPVAQLEVPVTTLDAWARRQAIARVDLLEIDTQGTEDDVIAGAAALLSGGKVAVVRVEVGVRPFYHGQPDFSVIDALLRSFGFDLVDYRFLPDAGGPVRRDGVGVQGEGPRWTATADATYVRKPDASDGASTTIAAVILAQLGCGSEAAWMLARRAGWSRPDLDVLLQRWGRPTIAERRRRWLRDRLTPALVEAWRRGLAGPAPDARRPVGHEPGAAIRDVALDDPRLPPTLVVVASGTPAVLRRLRRWWPRIDLHAFEPEPEAHRALSRTTGYHAVHADGRALASDVGLRVLHVARRSGWHSLLEPDPAACERHFGQTREHHELVENLATTARVEVATTTLDAWAGAAGIPLVHLLALDANGTELDALRGASGLLGAGRVCVVHATAALLPVRRGQPPWADLHRYLLAAGFHFVDCRFEPGAVARTPWPTRRYVEPPRWVASTEATYVADPGRWPQPARAARAVATAMVLSQLGYGRSAVTWLSRHGGWRAAEAAATVDAWTARSRAARWRSRVRAWLPPWLVPGREP